MKLLKFSRQQIVRAVRAACIGLFFAACVARAQAQSHSVEYTVSGSTVTGAGPSNNASAFFSGASGQGYTVTINSGVALGNTTRFDEVDFDHGTLTNNGALSGGTEDTIFMTGTGTVTNSSGSSITNSSNDVVVLGSATVTNSGYLNATSGTGIVGDGGGTFNNTATGTIVAETGIALDDQGTVTNSGVIQAAGGYGVEFASLGTLTLTNTSTGSISSKYGIFDDGSGTVTNSGYMKATAGVAIQIKTAPAR